MLELKEREELKKGTLRIAKFIRDKRIRTVVAIGPSAVIPNRSILKVLKKRYPNEEVPKIYSLGRIEDCFKIGKIGSHEEHDPKKLKRAAELIKTSRSSLVQRLKEPMLLFDESAVTGETLEGAKKTFEEHLNANEVYTAALQAVPFLKYRPSVVGFKSSSPPVPPVFAQRGLLEIELRELREKKFGRLKKIREFWDQLLQEI